MSDILEELTALRLEDARKRMAKGRSFMKALKGAGINIIAELKKASPSEGLIRADFAPGKLALELAGAGAAALSVLCEEHRFLGSEEYLRTARSVVDIPILYKDFISSPRQVAEAFAAGADAILLIAAVLDDDTLKSLLGLANDIGLDALIETHDENEIERAVRAGGRIIGVNCRNLRNFTCDTSLIEKLIGKIPSGIVRVAESGMHNREAILRARDAGADAFLVGTALMKDEDPASALRAMLQE